jgi:hypothetical protein
MCELLEAEEQRAAARRGRRSHFALYGLTRPKRDPWRYLLMRKQVEQISRNVVVRVSPHTTSDLAFGAFRSRMQTERLDSP